MAALTQGDDKLQLPLINNLGNEVWKCKEAKLDGRRSARPWAIRKNAVSLWKRWGQSVSDGRFRYPNHAASRGGPAGEGVYRCTHGRRFSRDVGAITKLLPVVDVDLAALAPAPDLTMVEEKKGGAGARKGRQRLKRPRHPKAAPAPKTAPAPAPARSPGCSGRSGG